MRSSEIDALCVDYDRTLTTPDLRRVPQAIQALARARDAGKRIVVVSGRDLDFLEREVGKVCDAIVGENGCFLLHGGARTRLAPTLALRSALAALDVPIEHGAAIASVDLAHAELVRTELARRRIDASLVRNRDRVMVLPRAVDKASGALAALRALGVPPERAAAAGDGENDITMLQAVGHAIAVANAVDEVKRVADHVTIDAGGHGIARWIDERWLAQKESA